MNDETMREHVRDRYGAIARERSSRCCGSDAADSRRGGSCCGDAAATASGRRDSDAQRISSELGYTNDDMTSVPDGANLGLGCGNPTALAGISEGETVVDLGSGAGFDCFLAARRVGPSGIVIGVDMTADMISRARANARTGGYSNVEFRLGEIEHLPIADGVADLVISNCVINLSVDKPSVFAEAFRVLRPGGRLMVSDIVLDGELPQVIRGDAAAYSACIAGAVARDRYLGMMRDAGFSDVAVRTETPFTDELVVQVGDEQVVVPDHVIVSISVSATRP